MSDETKKIVLADTGYEGETIYYFTDGTYYYLADDPVVAHLIQSHIDINDLEADQRSSVIQICDGASDGVLTFLNLPRLDRSTQTDIVLEYSSTLKFRALGGLRGEFKVKKSPRKTL